MWIADQEITETQERLIRRWYRNGSRKTRLVVDAVTQAPRLPAAAFRLRKEEEYLSTNIEESLRKKGLEVTWSPNPEKEFHAARITVGDCLQFDLLVRYKPLVDNPHHAGIFGLAEIRADDEDRYESTTDSLARASMLLTT